MSPRRSVFCDTGAGAGASFAPTAAVMSASAGFAFLLKKDIVVAVQGRSRPNGLIPRLEGLKSGVRSDVRTEQRCNMM